MGAQMLDLVLVEVDHGQLPLDLITQSVRHKADIVVEQLLVAVVVEAVVVEEAHFVPFLWQLQQQALITQ